MITIFIFGGRPSCIDLFYTNKLLTNNTMKRQWWSAIKIFRLSFCYFFTLWYNISSNWQPYVLCYSWRLELFERYKNYNYINFYYNLVVYVFGKPQYINYSIRLLGIEVVNSTRIRHLFCIMMTVYYPIDVRQYQLVQLLHTKK